jgi:hypothetical protein
MDAGKYGGAIGRIRRSIVHGLRCAMK